MKKLLTTGVLLTFATVVVAGCSQQNAEPFGATDVDHPGYQHHTQISVEDAVAQYDDVVLFFGASRCPLCRSLNSDIRENLDMIPEDLVIVTYDYDTAEDEKEMYEVTSQHTLIYLDDDGEEMKRTVKQETTLQAVVDEFAALNGEENTAGEASNTPPVDNPAGGASDGNSEADTGNSTASADTAIEVEAEVATE